MFVKLIVALVLALATYFATGTVNSAVWVSNGWASSTPCSSRA